MGRTGGGAETPWPSGWPFGLASARGEIKPGSGGEKLETKGSDREEKMIS